MDMQQMLKQAQQFQQRLSEVQKELAQRQVSAAVGGGMVTATVNGRYELIDLVIAREVVDPADPGMLQDLVISAVNEAMRKARIMSEGELGKLTGGMKIPGIFP